MEQNSVLQMLEQVRQGTLLPEEALLKLKLKPYEELGYAKVDHHRLIRQGVSEVIYGSGKTVEQISGIASSLLESDGENIIITRLSSEKAKMLESAIPIWYDPISNIGIVNRHHHVDSVGKIVVATGGTSDQSVAEEAAVTAETLGNQVTRLYDVGVAGLHRLLSKMDIIMSANVIIAVAGMEGALASVIGGLAECPVIAVPTSIGYGANFAGLSALLSMLNSCASGVSVVNIDNGFGAGYLASMINHINAVRPIKEEKLNENNLS